MNQWSMHLPQKLLCLVALLYGLITLDSVAHATVPVPGRFQFQKAEYRTTEALGVAYVTILRNLGSDGRAAVYVTSVSQSAVAGKNFLGIFNRSVQWQDGDGAEKELYVPIYDDRWPEEQQLMFELFLHDPNGAPINTDRSRTQVLIMPPSDVYTGSFRFLTSKLDVYETMDGNYTIVPVVWEFATTARGKVKYQITCGSACSPNDFVDKTPTAATGILEFNHAATNSTAAMMTTTLQQNITLWIKDDALYELDESFGISLIHVEETSADATIVTSYGSIGLYPSLQVTIKGPNNVVAGFIQFEADCFPGCASHKFFSYDGGMVRGRIQRLGGSDGSAQVTLQTVDGTAVASVDYVAFQKTFFWADGDASERIFELSVMDKVIRPRNTRFGLALLNAHGAQLSPLVSSTSYVDIIGPSNVYLGQVNFATQPMLNAVLKYPDLTFLPFVTKLDSGRWQCPRAVIRQPGSFELLLQRSFANVPWGSLGDVSVSVHTVPNTALDGIDYVGLADPTTITWPAGDTSVVKSLTLPILQPTAYSPVPKTFVLEMVSVSNIQLGDCNRIEIVLQGLTVVPHLVSFDLDMNLGKLNLVISEPVLASSLDASRLLLQSTKSLTPSTEVMSLTAATTTTSADGTSILLTLGTNDLNTLRAKSQLGKAPSTTFLSAQERVFDYNLNACQGKGPIACAHALLAAVPPQSALQVTTFTPDTTPPTLLSFSIDLPTQLLKLRFSEAVDRRTVRISALFLADSATAMNSYQLTPASSSLFSPTPDPLSGALYQDGGKVPSDNTYIVILLGKADLAGIKATGNNQIGVARGSTYLWMASTFVVDFATTPNPVVAIAPPAALMQVAPSSCSLCGAGQFVASSCTDLRDRVCRTCTVCPTNSFALVPCTAISDTVCYPCTECRGSQYAASECTSTSDRVCAPCTKCTLDEYEASPCYNGVNRVCRTCDSCLLTSDQQRTCRNSFKWRRRQMKAPYGCPLSDAEYQTMEDRLQTAKSNHCGAGRCSCTGNRVGNFNPNGDSYPDDTRCTGPSAYNVYI